MKGNLKALVVFLVLFSTPVFSGEVTDKEWMGQGILIVTYYHDGAYSEVNCMAFNEQGKPIGSGYAHPRRGGVARIDIQVPRKYTDQELKVSCKLESKKAAVKHDLTDEYKAKMLAKIKSRIIMPPDLPENPVAEFDITLLPSGEILEVKLRKSSGFITFDIAVDNAIIMSSPLPLPPDPTLFPNYQNLSLKIHYLE